MLRLDVEFGLKRPNAGKPFALVADLTRRFDLATPQQMMRLALGATDDATDLRRAPGNGRLSNGLSFLRDHTLWRINRVGLDVPLRVDVLSQWANCRYVLRDAAANIFCRRLLVMGGSCVQPVCSRLNRTTFLIMSQACRVEFLALFVSR